MTRELKQQFTRRISAANKTQLVVILYEMFLTYIQEARQAFENQDTEGFRQGIKRAKGCLHELMMSLNYDYARAGNLLALYTFFDRQLTRADARKSAQELGHVEAMMRKLHDAYEAVSGQDTSPAVMANTQTIYAGLTYGKNNLTENLADQGSSRGFLA